MKAILTLLLTSIFFISSMTFAYAEKQVSGPKGGKLLGDESPRPEFLVEKDHKVTITFYNEDLKPVPAGQQVMTATVEKNGTKTKIDFEKKGDVLVSKTPLPAGDGYNIVVQLRKDSSAKPQNFRIKYDTHICGECKMAEYACTCHD